MMTTKSNNLVKVQLRVHKPLENYQGRSNDYFVAVTGPGLQLGNENPNIAPRCKPVGHNFWQKDLWLPKDSTVHYKFLVVKTCSDVTVDLETILPHKIYIGQNPIMVEHIFNKQAFAGKEVYDENSRSPPLVGRKDTFHVPSLNIPKSDKVSFVVPKIRNPPKYTPPRNIGMILHKSMTPDKDKSKGINAPFLTATHKNEDNNNILRTCLTEEQAQPEADRFKHANTNIENVKSAETPLTAHAHSQNSANLGSSANSDQEPSHCDGAIFVNGVSEDKGGHSRYFKVEKKSLAMVAAGVALVSCLGYFAFYRR